MREGGTDQQTKKGYGGGGGGVGWGTGRRGLNRSPLEIDIMLTVHRRSRLLLVLLFLRFPAQHSEVTRYMKLCMTNAFCTVRGYNV